MADKARRVDYFTIDIPDQPGEAFKVLSKIKESGVNLESVTGFPTGGGKGQLSVVPEKADKFASAAKAAGLPVGAAKKALFVEGSDRTGATAEILKRLLDAKLNVTAFNAASSRGKFGMILWFKPETFEAAAKALGA